MIQVPNAPSDCLGLQWKEVEKERDENWMRIYEELKVYKARHGDCNVSRTYGSLGKWVINQRYRRKGGHLNERRIKLLDDINFIWQTRPARYPVVKGSSNSNNHNTVQLMHDDGRSNMNLNQDQSMMNINEHPSKRRKPDYEFPGMRSTDVNDYSSYINTKDESVSTNIFLNESQTVSLFAISDKVLSSSVDDRCSRGIPWEGKSSDNKDHPLNSVDPSIALTLPAIQLPLSIPTIISDHHGGLDVSVTHSSIRLESLQQSILDHEVHLHDEDLHEHHDASENDEDDDENVSDLGEDDHDNARKYINPNPL